MPQKMKAPGAGTVQRVTGRSWRMLGSVPLFSGLRQRDLRRVADLSEEVWFPAGQVVVEEGKAALAFYVVLDGTARVVRGASKRLLARLGPGDHFGELALIDNRPRFASVIAESTLDTIRLKRTAFRNMLLREPEVALRIMEGMAGLIRDLQPEVTE